MKGQEKRWICEQCSSPCYRESRTAPPGCIYDCNQAIWKDADTSTAIPEMLDTKQRLDAYDVAIALNEVIYYLTAERERLPNIAAEMDKALGNSSTKPRTGADNMYPKQHKSSRNYRKRNSDKRKTAGI